MLKTLSLIALLAAAFTISPNLFAADGEMAPAPAPAPAAEGAANPEVKPFPLSFCVTCGDEFAAEQEHIVTKVHKGREVKLCKGCVKIFNADPDGYLKQVDKSIKTGKPVKEGH